MKKKMLLVLTAIAVVLFSVGIVAAQGEKKMTKGEMDMDAMHKSPHHMLMMAHHNSGMAFATLLRDMTKDGKLADVEVARNAFVIRIRAPFDTPQFERQVRGYPGARC